MPMLQISDIDQRTVALLRQWAADRGRTLEDGVRIILEKIAAQIESMPARRATEQSIAESGRSGPSRGALSLEPMSLSAEDAAIMEDAWRTGLARPSVAFAPLPQYEG